MIICILELCIRYVKRVSHLLIRISRAPATPLFKREKVKNPNFNCYWTILNHVQSHCPRATISQECNHFRCQPCTVLQYQASLYVPSPMLLSFHNVYSKVGEVYISTCKLELLNVSKSCPMIFVIATARIAQVFYIFIVVFAL